MALTTSLRLLDQSFAQARTGGAISPGDADALRQRAAAIAREGDDGDRQAVAARLGEWAKFMPASSGATETSGARSASASASAAPVARRPAALRAQAPAPSSAVLGLMTPHATRFEQWLAWENELTFPDFVRDDIKTHVPYAAVPASAVDVLSVPDLPQSIASALGIGGAQLRWPRHPDNTIATIPHAGDPQAGALEAWYTSSRSMIVRDAGSGAVFSLKMPTDAPNKGTKYPLKADLSKEVHIAVMRGAHVLAAERELGAHPRLVTLPDVASLRDPESGNGVVVRDVTKLLGDEAHRYMPGFGITALGQAQGLSPMETAQLEAKLSGQIKADLLLHYGLWSKSPHGQNKLYQLDDALRPTEVAVLRDLSDTSLVGPIARALGFGQAVDASEAAGHSVMRHLPDDWSITIAGLDHSGFTPWSTLNAARPAHDRAFTKTIRETLAGLSPSFDQAAQGAVTVAAMSELLCSPVGTAAIAQHALRLRAAAD